MIAHRVSLAKLSRRAQSPSGDIFHVRACASTLLLCSAENLLNKEARSNPGFLYE
jgi:hypothetical protein